MKIRGKLKQVGFSLIELAITIVLIGVLATFIIPKYMDFSSQALTASKEAMSGIVKSAFASTYMEQGDYPTLSEVATNVQGGVAYIGGTSGIQVSIDGNSYVVPVYKYFDCTGNPTATSDVVKCVGDIL